MQTEQKQLQFPDEKFHIALRWQIKWCYALKNIHKTREKLILKAKKLQRPLFRPIRSFLNWPSLRISLLWKEKKLLKFVVGECEIGCCCQVRHRITAERSDAFSILAHTCHITFQSTIACSTSLIDHLSLVWYIVSM